MAQLGRNDAGVNPIAEDEFEALALQAASARLATTQQGQAAAPSQAPRQIPEIDPMPAGVSSPAGRPAEASQQHSRPAGSGGKTIVIKGGPRRVVRADGLAPNLDVPMGQERFELSSGHRMFTRYPRMPKALGALLGLVALALIALVVLAAWNWSKSSITLEEQQGFVATSSYDGALSLTPAEDGGYYTVFLVTSTETNEQQVGELAQAFLYRTDARTDRTVSDVVKVNIPLNLSVSDTAADSSSTTAPLSEILTSRGVTRALRGIDSAFGVRLYNVIVISQPQFDALSAVIEGRLAPEGFDAESLLGHVRTNLELQQIVDFAGVVASLGGPSVSTFTAPTVDVQSSNGMILAAGQPVEYKLALRAALSGVSGPVLDQYGYPAGTQYDEMGYPLVDGNLNPLGTIYGDDGLPLLDENGYVVIYGQQYDGNGMPVGTQYDEWGNALLDDYGNPLGTQYNEDGSVQVDWRGNMVIIP